MLSLNRQLILKELEIKRHRFYESLNAQNISYDIVIASPFISHHSAHFNVKFEEKQVETGKRLAMEPLERTVGFFNVFEKDKEVFDKIIKEMIGSLESSGVLNDVFSIEYVYFGPNHTSYSIPSSSPKFVKSKASNSSGNEAVTLQLLHTHCARYPDDRVFYIHSKGSFHPSSSNNVLRRNLLKAVIFCIHSSDSVMHGDVCGLRVSPVPYPQMSGASASAFSQSRILEKEFIDLFEMYTAIR